MRHPVHEILLRYLASSHSDVGAGDAEACADSSYDSVGSKYVEHGQIGTESYHASRRGRPSKAALEP